MLGSLARWLRVCGYDAEYLQDLPDEELIKRAADEDRALLTMDKLLYRKGQKAGLDTLLVEGESDAQKLALVSMEYGLELDPRNSRCPKCDGELSVATKTHVKGRVPTRTFEAYDDFWVCRSCGQVYWRGSHWRDIVRTVDEATRLASQPIAGGKEHL
jgi:hypothetical protein